LRSMHGQSAPVDDPELKRRLLAFSAWAMIAGVTWQVLQYYPAWYLNKIMGNEAVAVFSAVRQGGQLVLLCALTVGTVGMTAVVNTWEPGGVAAADRQLSLAFRGAGVVMLLGCAAISLARNVVVRLFSGSYSAGAEILPLQLFFFLIGGNFAFIVLHFTLIEKPRLQFLPYGIGVAAHVVLGQWFLGPRLGWLRAAAGGRAACPL